MATISTTAVARQSWALFQKHWMLFFHCAAIVSLPLILIPPLGMALANYCAIECSERTLEFVGLAITCIFAAASFILKTSALNILFLVQEGKAVSWQAMFDFKKHKNFMFRYFLFLLQLAVASLALALLASVVVGLPMNHFGITTEIINMKIAELIEDPQMMSKGILVAGALVLAAITFWIGIRVAYALFDYAEHASRSFLQSFKHAYKITRGKTLEVLIYHIKALFFYAWVLVPLFVVYLATAMFPLLTPIAIVLYSVWSAISVFHSICIYKALAK